MTRIRAAVRGSWLGPFISLVLLWAGVAIPIVDRELAHDSSPAVCEAGSGSSTLSHDHRLCLLLQVSPGWASPYPAPLEPPVVSRDERPSLHVEWTPRDAHNPTHARAPPLHI